MLAIEPQAADATTGPTAAERQAALDKANQAVADLNAGKDFAEVAQNYGTDAKSQAGGDLGSITQIALSDDTLGQAALRPAAERHHAASCAATTAPTASRRVTEITPGTENPALKTKLLAEPLRGERPPADRLRRRQRRPPDQGRQRRSGATPEQAKLAVDLHRGRCSPATTAPRTARSTTTRSSSRPNDNLDTRRTWIPTIQPGPPPRRRRTPSFAQLQAITDIDAAQDQVHQRSPPATATTRPRRTAARSASSRATSRRRPSATRCGPASTPRAT